MSQSLQSQLATDILQRINAQSMPAGTRLSERSLAEALRVSRSPVRTALRQLADQALIDPHPDGGFVVGAGALQVKPTALISTSDQEDLYLRIAQERLDGKLPARVSENELMRRYEVTRSQLTDILRRISNEGWMERLPGHGWAFTEVMTSSVAYADSYRYRILVEPAAILEPTFRIDEAGLKQCRQEQQSLVNSEVHHVSPAQIFDANTRLHETIAACCGNTFILDSLRRINRVRRLMEYRKAVDRQQALRRCEEHLVLIDLLLAGQLEKASSMMRTHLRDAAREKRAVVSA
ncbi:GntR family transcriptional regulator [Bordetella muralis]|jgi:DNA-binding GntR family transcriptional regulator|uniref:GntR family transcriptional regulator n=1 Tax=Bordetella muralis TaxID=1649130 RepID=UPI0039F0EA29